MHKRLSLNLLVATYQNIEDYRICLKFKNIVDWKDFELP